MDESTVEEILNEKGYSDIPKDAIRDFVRSLNKERNLNGKENGSIGKNINTKKTEEKQNSVERQKKSEGGKKKKCQKKDNLSTLINFSTEDEICKYKREIKDLKNYGNEITQKIDMGISYFKGE
jgi:hypothetical protein